MDFVVFFTAQVMTIYVSYKNIKNINKNMIDLYFKNGYKVKGDHNEIIKSLFHSNTDKKNNLKYCLKFLVLITPFINAIYTFVLSHYIPKKKLEEAVKENLFIELTTEEKEMYRTLISNSQKLKFLNQLSMQLVDNEKPVIEESLEEINVLVLSDNPVDNSKFTVEAVEELAEIFDNEYMFGKVDGQYISILGTSEECSSISFESSNSQKQFEKVNHEEVIGEEFYLYTKVVNFEKEEEFEDKPPVRIRK